MLLVVCCGLNNKKRLRDLIKLSTQLNEISQPLLRLVIYTMWLLADFPSCLPLRRYKRFELDARTTLFVIKRTVLQY